MAYSYSVFFNGVFHSRHSAKGAALDAAYRHVNFAQRCNHDHGVNGSEHCRATAESLSRLLGVLASLIPDARRARCAGRHILNVCEAGQTLSVRRDTL
jgi:hypothetical protein